MENKNNKLSWLCINKYLPELDINNIKETLLKSGVTFFNLHRMEKGYFPTSLIKFQVETNKTDLSDLNNKNIKINNRDYIIRKYTEKPRQDYRYRYANFAEKPRRCYVKPHPSTRFRKENITTEKTIIEPKKTNIEPITNNQNKLAENLADITRRLATIQKTLQELKNTLQELAKERKLLRELEKKEIIRDTIITTERDTIADIIDENQDNIENIVADITKTIIRNFKLKKKIDILHITSLMEGAFKYYNLCQIPDIPSIKSKPDSDKGP